MNNNHTHLYYIMLLVQLVCDEIHQDHYKKKEKYKIHKIFFLFKTLEFDIQLHTCQ